MAKLKEHEMKITKKQDRLYELANVELKVSESSSGNHRYTDSSVLRKLIKKSNNVYQKDIEERFRFMKIDEYRKQESNNFDKFTVS